MASYPEQPTPDTLIITGDGPLDAHHHDVVQVLHPKHLGVTRIADRSQHGTLQIGSDHCAGCGERQTEIMIIGPNGKALYVKLRPSMAIKLGELLMIHGKAGMLPQ